jgi:enoyl-CoA hydratase
MGKIYDSFYRLGQVKIPTVAAVRGSAVGAGTNMLLATDLRIVARHARLLCGFLKRGMHPGGGHFVILSHLIGREAAAMALFGEEINGDKAVDLGPAWESVDDVDERRTRSRTVEGSMQSSNGPLVARCADLRSAGARRGGGCVNDRRRATPRSVARCNVCRGGTPSPRSRCGGSSTLGD